MMKLNDVSNLGSRILGSFLIVACLSLTGMTIGCGGAAQEAQIDTSVPEEDPTDMGTDAAAALEETDAAN